MVKEYRLFCAPDTKAIERDINKLLEEFPEAQTVFLQPCTGQYYNRRLVMQCRKCGSEVTEADGNIFLCSNCKRTYTKKEFERNAYTVFSQAGTLFLQPLIVKR